MNNSTLHVFDLDDTLLITPTFSAMLPQDENGVIEIEGKFSEFFLKIKSFFFVIFSKEVYFAATGDFVAVFDANTKKPLSADYMAYIQDLDPLTMSTYGLKPSIIKDVLRALEVQHGALVFRSIPEFHENPETVGKIVNDEVYKSYKSAINKMIVTGRKIVLKPVLEKRLQELGLELPNFGLYCFPGGAVSIQNYKINTILDSIKINGWSEIHFYEDRKDWLVAAQKAVEEVYPQVIFYPHLITLSKHMRSL